MGAIADIWKSERGLICVAILICATVLVVTGHLPIDGWTKIVMVVAASYMISKGATGVASIVKGSTPDASDVSADPDLPKDTPKLP